MEQMKISVTTGWNIDEIEWHPFKGIILRPKIYTLWETDLEKRLKTAGVNQPMRENEGEKGRMERKGGTESEASERKRYLSKGIVRSS